MSGLPFTGQVVDATTGKPIEGAYVVAQWASNAGIADSRSICYHVETAVSDKSGRYRISGWIGGKVYMMDTVVITEVYKNGCIKHLSGNPTPAGMIYVTRFSAQIESGFNT